MHNALPTLDVVASLLPSAVDVPDWFRCCRARATTGNRCQEAPKSTPEAPKSTLGGSKVEPRSPKRIPGAPKSAQERPKSDPRAAKSAQERAKRAKLAAKRVPEEPQVAFQGTPERPREPFWRSETRESRFSKLLSGVTRWRSAFDAIFRWSSKRARKCRSAKNM